MKSQEKYNFFSTFKKRQLIAAHRGFRALYPENTLSAFQASVGHCDFIEFDVQMSADGIPVVFHDATLERTSNVGTICHQLGMHTIRVNDWTLAQLKMLDVGSWFIVADPFKTIREKKQRKELLYSLMPQRIPTLAEFLSCPALSTLPLNIEIKHQENKEGKKDLTETVIDLVRRYNAIERVLISSFNHEYLRRAKKIEPNISLGVLQDYEHPAELVSYIHEIGAIAYHPSDALVDEVLVEELNQAGIRVNVYTVNSSTRQRELFRQGVTAIFTDFPQLDENIKIN